MDAAESLADLKQISTQIDRAVIVRADGTVAGSTVADAALSNHIAEAGVRLWDAADRARKDLGRPQLSQLEVATGEGSVFAVRDDEFLIVASTPPEPTVGLIFYDLKTCLRNLREQPEDVAPADVANRSDGGDDGTA
jgi:predicted regulator of Ras-like GTPase activity (Roadblock/LC7/MglB family)